MPRTQMPSYSPSPATLLASAAGLLLVLGTIAACSEPGGGGADSGIDEDTGLDISYGEGSWEECCKEGEISTCYCPGGVDCGYGAFTQCGGGSCAVPPMTCSGDAGDVDHPPDSADGGDAGPVPDTGRDTGPTDTGPTDTGPIDTGTPDTATPDTSMPDTEPADTAPSGDADGGRAADTSGNDATDIVETDAP